MTTLSQRLARCPEPTCIRRDAHEFHSDGRGRTWAFRDPYQPAWMRRAKEREHGLARVLSGDRL